MQCLCLQWSSRLVESKIFEMQLSEEWMIIEFDCFSTASSPFLYYPPPTPPPHGNAVTSISPQPPSSRKDGR